MYLDLDEPQGFRYENDQKQAQLTMALLGLFSIGAVAWLAYLVKCVSYAG